MYQIEVINVEELTPQMRVSCQALTTHDLETPNLTLLAALNNGVPVGLVVAKLAPKVLSAVIYSLYVQPEHRRHCLATRLLEELEKNLRQKKCFLMCMNYPSASPSTPAFEAILKKLHWGTPFPHIQRLFFDTDRFQPPWAKRLRPLPEEFSIFPWNTLTNQERLSLKADAARGTFSPSVTPFQDEELIEPINSLGLRHLRQVVGWIITHRVEPNTIRYTALYIHPRHKDFGLPIQLLMTSIKRQQQAHIPWSIFDVNFEQTPTTWKQFVLKRLLPYAQKATLFKRSWKDLR